MLADMVHQVLLASERLGAVVTPMRGFTGMPHYMVFIVILAREVLSTDITVEWRVGYVRASLSVDRRRRRGYV